MGRISTYNAQSGNGWLQPLYRRSAFSYLRMGVLAMLARRVGARRGRPVVLEVDARVRRRDGHDFYLSENGVWLVERVPPRYLRRLWGTIRCRGRGPSGRRLSTTKRGGPL